MRVSVKVYNTNAIRQNKDRLFKFLMHITHVILVYTYIFIFYLINVNDPVIIAPLPSIDI